VPELPDVEGFRRVLSKHARGRQIERIEVADPGVLRNTTPDNLKRELEGRQFDEPARHGKWLLAGTDGPILLFHFGMSGALVWASVGGRHPHDRVIFGMDQGELRYRDQRKLQGLWLVLSDHEAERVMGPLGPDALQLSQQELVSRLCYRRAMLKAVLMNQSVLAGLGNLLVDEILWQSKLNPLRPANRLDGDEMERLHRTMQLVLRDRYRKVVSLPRVYGLPASGMSPRPHVRAAVSRSIGGGWVDAAPYGVGDVSRNDPHSQS
jgi:formamidopyrimidine-DNA glycosylase